MGNLLSEENLYSFDYKTTIGDGDLDFFDHERRLVLVDIITVNGLDQPIPVFRVSDGSRYDGKLIVMQPRGPNMLDRLFDYGNVSAVLHFYKPNNRASYEFPHQSK